MFHLLDSYSVSLDFKLGNSLFFNIILFFSLFFSERGLEIGVLQDNADLLKSQNASLNEQAQNLSLQMTVRFTMKFITYCKSPIKEFLFLG